MPGTLTLTRRHAALKLTSIKRATYYFQRYEGVRYTKEATVMEDVVQAFMRDPRARLKIDLATSAHRITLVDQRSLQIGWEVEF